MTTTTTRQRNRDARTGNPIALAYGPDQDALNAYAISKAWTVHHYTDLDAALDALEAGHADTLVTTAPVPTGTAAKAAVQGWRLAIVEQEPSQHGGLTRAGMARRKAEGARFGTRRVTPPWLVARICRMHASGTSYSAIARALNAENVPTARGGKAWLPGTVQQIVQRWHGEVAATS